MNNFHPGEAVRLYITSIASSSGGIADPEPLKLSYWAPNSAVLVATTSEAITYDSSGAYHAEVVPTTSQVGRWDYRWSSTGDYPLSQWGAFRVLEPVRST